MNLTEEQQRRLDIVVRFRVARTRIETATDRADRMQERRKTHPDSDAVINASRVSHEDELHELEEFDQAQRALDDATQGREACSLQGSGVQSPAEWIGISESQLDHFVREALREELT